MVSAPLPSPIGVFDAIRNSCRNCRQRNGLELGSYAINAFLEGLVSQEEEWTRIATNHGTKLPLKFDSIEQEVNVIALFALLNFSSGYRVELKRLTQRGAFDTIRSLVLSLYISQYDLSARGLEKVTDHDIVEMGQIPVSVDVKHEFMEGVTVSQPTKLKRMAENIGSVLRETGEILRSGGYQSLGTFVIECAKRSKVDGKTGASASMFIHHVVKAIPAFRDMAIIDGEPVYVFKKVQLLALDLHTRFSSSQPDLFYFHDIDQLTIFADNVIPTMLHHLYIIPLAVPEDATQEHSNLIRDLKEDLQTGRETKYERSFILRAAAADACETIVQMARERSDAPAFIKKMTAPEIDAYLWQIAKKGEMRDAVRFCDPNTVFF